MSCLAAPPILDISDTLDVRGEHAFTVTNQSLQALTGMVVRVDSQPPGSSNDVHAKFFYDSVLNHFQPPLGTGQSYTFHVGSDKGDAHPMQISVESAIFSDGSTLGEQAAIQSLWKRREWSIVAYQDALDLADRSMTSSTDRTGAIKALTDVKRSRLYDTTRSIEERAAVNAAFSTVIGNLTDSANDVLPGAVIAKIRKRETERMATLQKQIVPAQVTPMQIQSH